MGGSHHVYLVPGFFGFANFGDFKYFAHVRRVLPPLLAARGVAASLHEVRVLPTSSLPRRASTLLETIDATSVDGDHVHIVGHSTGGLDARLLLAPGAELPEGAEVSTTVPPADLIASESFLGTGLARAPAVVGRSHTKTTATSAGGSANSSSTGANSADAKRPMFRATTTRSSNIEIVDAARTTSPIS